MNIAEKSVLIVDDTRLQRLLLTDMLKKMGVVKIYTAENGLEGVRSARYHKPDLVLLDLNMPILDGFEACEKIRLFSDKISMPIIVLTGQDKKSALEKFFSLGANDYFEKPFSTVEIKSRILFYLKYCDMLQRLNMLEETVQNDLNVARMVQQNTLPSVPRIKKRLVSVGLDFDAHYMACTGLGGDAWSVKFLANGHPVFFLFDVAGHGINAAINNSFIVSMTQSLFEKYERHDALSFDPDAFLRQLNEVLCRRMQGDTFCAGICFVYKPDENKISYAGCALPELKVMKNQDKKIESYICNGLPLGITPDNFVPTKAEIDFDEGDALFVTTDGLTESMPSKGKEVEADDNPDLLPGERLLKKVLQQVFSTNKNLSAQKIQAGILKGFEDKGYNMQGDDVTCMTLFRH